MEKTTVQQQESSEIENAIRTLNQKLQNLDCNSEECTIYIITEIEALEENIKNLKRKIFEA